MARFHRMTRYRTRRVLRRSLPGLLLIILLVSAADLLHDGRVSWLALAEQRLVGLTSELIGSTRRWLQRSPPFAERDEVTEPGTPAASVSASRAAGAVRDRPSAISADVVGQVLRVIDGDTIEVGTTDSDRLRVRLHGIDTPEWNQDHGKASGRALRKLIGGETVGLAIRDVDRLDRAVAVVYLDDTNINLEMVRRGHAWWYRQYARNDRELKRAEEDARRRGIGLWRSDDPIPPWEWRRRSQP